MIGVHGQSMTRKYFFSADLGYWTSILSSRLTLVKILLMAYHFQIGRAHSNRPCLLKTHHWKYINSHRWNILLKVHRYKAKGDQLSNKKELLGWSNSYSSIPTCNTWVIAVYRKSLLLNQRCSWLRLSFFPKLESHDILYQIHFHLNLFICFCHCAVTPDKGYIKICELINHTAMNLVRVHRQYSRFVTPVANLSTSLS